MVWLEVPRCPVEFVGLVSVGVVPFCAWVRSWFSEVVGCPGNLVWVLMVPSVVWCPWWKCQRCELVLDGPPVPVQRW